MASVPSASRQAVTHEGSGTRITKLSNKYSVPPVENVVIGPCN